MLSRVSYYWRAQAAIWVGKPSRVLVKFRRKSYRTFRCICLMATVTSIMTIFFHSFASDVTGTTSWRHGDDEFKINRSEPHFSKWRNRIHSTCDRRLTVHGASFARLRDVIVDRSRFSAQRRGGERLDDVINQDVNAEFYSLKPGGFRLDGCAHDSNTSLLKFEKKSYLNSWLAALRMTTNESFPVGDEEDPETGSHRVTTVTVALMRDEYANLYHTTSDWYNVFLSTVFFDDVSPVDAGVLLIDAHPASPLDDVWRTLFGGGVSRLSELGGTGSRTRFADLIWATPGHRSLFEKHFSHRLPLVEEFRRYVLARHRIDFRRTIDCSNISVLLIWRHDYITHPRNPAAVVRRKIANEDELETHLRRHNPSMRVTGVQLDRLPFGDQLRIVADSDVIIGMHGAGLTHAMFVPLGSALIELMPGYNMATNSHFRAIARWRHLVYENWIADQIGEDASTGYTTTVPSADVNRLMQTAIKRMCSN